MNSNAKVRKLMPNATPIKYINNPEKLIEGEFLV